MIDSNIKVAKAKTVWIDKNKLTSIINSGIKYAPLIYINGAKSNEIWSCIVNISNQLSDTEAIADISFLSSQAPNNLLIYGVKFSLYEGRKLVAYGEIINRFVNNRRLLTVTS